MSKNNIQYFREKKQYTQEQMAEKLDIPISTYGKIERGETAIIHKQLRNIADILEVEVYQLLPDHNINYFENNNFHIDVVGAVSANHYHDNKSTHNDNLNLILSTIQNNQQQLIDNQKLLFNLLQEIISKNNGKAD